MSDMSADHLETIAMALLRMEERLASIEILLERSLDVPPLQAPTARPCPGDCACWACRASRAGYG